MSVDQHDDRDEDGASQRWVIAPDPGGCRAALIDGDGFPTRLSYFRAGALNATGVLFHARVSGFDDASDMAFLELGDGRQGALSLRRAKHLVPSGEGPVTSIRACLTEGQMLLVQGIAEADEGDGKAIPVTARPRLAGRYVILELGGGKARINASKDIPPALMGRVRAALEPWVEAGLTILVRSRAAAVGAEEIEEEAERLATVALEALGHEGKPAQLWAEEPLISALMETPEGASVTLMGGGDTVQARMHVRERYTDLSDDFTISDDNLFETLGVNEAVEEALAGRVTLPSGGWISIHETPALTAIDVNMGSAFKDRPAAEAKRLVNMEAALAVAYHLRFQNIGGLIVVDFIDMNGKGAVKMLLDVMDDALREDDVPVARSNLSQFGMLELSRPRRGLSLRKRLLAPAPQPREDTLEATLALLGRAERLGVAGEPGVLVLVLPDEAIALLHALPDLMDRLKARTQRSVEIMAFARDSGGPYDAYLKAA